MTEQTHIDVEFTGPLAERLDAYFTDLGLGCNTATLVRERRDILYWLNAQSDAELIRMGMTRHDIPSVVFQDLFATPSRPGRSSRG